MAQDAAGIMLDRMHKALGQEVRRKNRREITVDFGRVDAYNLKDLARKGRGPAKKVA
jgi:hypothetical protein